MHEEQRQVIKDQVREAHEALRRATAKAVSDIATDVRVLKISNMVDGEVKEFPLYRGVWVTSQGGLRVMLIDDINQCPERQCPLAQCNSGCSMCTRALCSGNSRVEAHSHHYREYVQVIQGTLFEHTTGMEYGVGQTVYYAAGVVHEPELHGMAMICWQPPLALHSSQVEIPPEDPTPQETQSVYPDGTPVHAII